MVPGPILMLRAALSHLASTPSEQEKRLRGMVVRDELALDFVQAFESLESLPESGRLDASTMADLRVLYDKVSAGPDDRFWSEILDSPRWTEVRSMAALLIDHV